MQGVGWRNCCIITNDGDRVADVSGHPGWQVSAHYDFKRRFSVDHSTDVECSQPHDSRRRIKQRILDLMKVFN